MTIVNSDGPPRRVNTVTEEEARRIKDFLRGAVYCWCKNHRGEWFAARDLVGGDARWKGTPLMPLFDNHEGSTEERVAKAGKDAGWLLKAVLHEDQREFDSRDGGMAKEYCRIEGP